MEIKFLEQNIRQQFESITLFKVASNDPQIIVRASFLDPSVEELQSHTLYLCGDPELTLNKISSSKSSPINILLFSAELLPPLLRLNAPLNVFLLSQPVDQAKVLTFLNDLFYSRSEMEAMIQSISEAFYLGNGLQYLSGITGETLNNPVWITGLNYEYLTNPVPSLMRDPVFDSELSSGHVCSDDIVNLESRNIRAAVSSREFPTQITVEHLEMRMLIVPIRIKQTVVAFAHLLEQNHPFLDSDAEVLTHFAKLASSELQKASYFESQRGIAFSYFLSDLLNNKMNDELDLDKRLKALGHELHRYMRLIYLPIPQGVNVPLSTNIIVDGIKFIFPQLIYTILDHHAVFLLSGDTKNFPDATQQAHLQEFLSLNKLVVGISGCFCSLPDAPKFYHTASTALTIGHRLHPDQSIFFYEDYDIYHMFDLCGTGFLFDSLCGEAVKKLLDYDRNHDSMLLHTCYVFLTANCNVAKTAELLIIHKNTLRYRIEKVKRITGLTLENGLENAELLISILHYNYILNQ